jgi:hypothetical protein
LTDGSPSPEDLARVATVDYTTALLGVLSTRLRVRYELNSTGLILGGAAAGLALRQLGSSP